MSRKRQKSSEATTTKIKTWFFLFWSVISLLSSFLQKVVILQVVSFFSLSAWTMVSRALKIRTSSCIRGAMRRNRSEGFSWVAAWIILAMEGCTCMLQWSRGGLKWMMNAVWSELSGAYGKVNAIIIGCLFMLYLVSVVVVMIWFIKWNYSVQYN